MNPEAYRSWNQDLPWLNEEEAWPAALFPDAQYHYFADCGCLVTSLAVMLRRFRIEPETDEALFNPWILNRRLIEAGAFFPSADLDLRRISRLYPLEYDGQIPYSRETLVRLWETGNPFLVTVPGVRAPRHFIAPDQLTEDDLTVFDPLWPKKRLSEYETVCELRVFVPAV